MSITGGGDPHSIYSLWQWNAAHSFALTKHNRNKGCSVWHGAHWIITEWEITQWFSNTLHIVDCSSLSHTSSLMHQLQLIIFLVILNVKPNHIPSPDWYGNNSSVHCQSGPLTGSEDTRERNAIQQVKSVVWEGSPNLELNAAVSSLDLCTDARDNPTAWKFICWHNGLDTSWETSIGSCFIILGRWVYRARLSIGKCNCTRGRQNSALADLKHYLHAVSKGNPWYIRWNLPMIGILVCLSSSPSNSPPPYHHHHPVLTSTIFLFHLATYVDA